MKTREKKSPRVGDEVIVRVGKFTVQAVVVEDRGNIGAGGRHLLKVKTIDDDSSLSFDMPADQIDIKKSG